MGIEKVSQHLYDDEELAQNRAKAPDAKESFECGDEESNEMPNIWLPDGIFPGFKETCLEFFWVGQSVVAEYMLIPPVAVPRA
jgi:hypothetical protein